MAWTVVAQANSESELYSLTPLYADVPAGTEVNIHLELQWWAPIGKLANLAGAEFWAPRLAQADLDVIDVSGDWHYIDIRGTARGMGTVLLIAILAAAVATLGLGVYIASVVITANMEEKKLEQANAWIKEGYTPEQVTQMLKEVKPATPKLPALDLPEGITIGVIVVGVIALVLLLKK